MTRSVFRFRVVQVFLLLACWLRLLIFLIPFMAPAPFLAGSLHQKKLNLERFQFFLFFMSGCFAERHLICFFMSCVVRIFHYASNTILVSILLFFHTIRARRIDTSVV
jgi:hypothetical protein